MEEIKDKIEIICKDYNLDYTTLIECKKPINQHEYITIRGLISKYLKDKKKYTLKRIGKLFDMPEQVISYYIRVVEKELNAKIKVIPISTKYSNICKLLKEKL